MIVGRYNSCLTFGAALRTGCLETAIVAVDVSDVTGPAVVPVLALIVVLVDKDFGIDTDVFGTSTLWRDFSSSGGDFLISPASSGVLGRHGMLGLPGCLTTTGRVGWV